MTLKLSKISIVPIFLALTACGGAETGAGEGAGTPTTNLPGTSTGYATGPSGSIYPHVTNTVTAQVTDIAGSLVITNGSTGDLSAATSSGTVDASTGIVNVSQGPYTFTSGANAYTSTGLMTDGAGATILANAGLGANYEYLVVYNGTFTDTGVNYDTLGVLGAVTNGADVPTTGTANYSGSANLSVVTQNGFSRLYSDGTSNITVNFATSSANMTLNNFTVTNRSGQATNSSEFDTLNVNNMSIAGASMSGGTVTFVESGQQVDIVGNNPTQTVSGTFYGYDEINSIPDEVGGIVLVSGDTGQVTGVFVAD